VATTLTDTQELTYVSFPIEKAETTPDGDLIVIGKATDGSVDSDEQIVDPDFAGKALRDWLETGGNVRVQHNPQRDPAGKGLAVEVSPDGHYVKSLIVEPTARRLVEKGVLRAYSVGIARPVIMRDSVARGGRITGGQIVELSLVDRPANKNCGINLVKSADDGMPEYIGKVFGADILAKSEGDSMDDGEAVKTVTLDLPEDISVAFSPRDMAKLLSHKQKLMEKEIQASGKVVDSSGEDRSDMAGKDFAGPGKTFPIETQGDVSDAASLAHHAADPGAVRSRIRSIAQRKWPGMTMPPSLSGKEADPDLEKDDDGDDDWTPPFPGAARPFKKKDPDAATKGDDGGKQCSLCKGSGKIREGHVTCPKCKGDGTLTPKESDDFANRSVEADVEKAGDKACSGCGKNYHSDSKQVYCENCGKKLPLAKGSAEAEAAKAEKAEVLAFIERALKARKEDNDDDDDDDDDSEMDDSCSDASMGKSASGKDGMPGDGNTNDDDDSLDGLDSGTTDDDGDSSDASSATGKVKPPASGKNRKAKVKKAGVPTKGTESPAADPVPKHREPDGAPMEAFEDDAGLQDGDQASKAVRKYRELGMPSTLGAIHALTCPAYSEKARQAAHPYATLANLIHVPDWQAKAIELSAKAMDLDDAKAAVQIGQHAATLKNTPEPLLVDIREHMHKSYQDATTGPGKGLTPGMMSAGRFTRPLITDGQEAASPGHSGPNKAPVPSSQIAASQFTRGFQTAGTASDSPANSNPRPMAVNPPQLPGDPTKVGYTQVMARNAEQALAAMHDHVSRVFPDVCPMYNSAMGGPYRNNGGALPAPSVPAMVGGPESFSKAATKKTEAATRKKLAKRVFKGEMTLEEAQRILGLDQPAAVTKAAGAAMQQMSAVPEDLTAVLKQMAEAIQAQQADLKSAMRELKKTDKERRELETRLEAQALRLDKMENEPDVAGGPYLGAVGSLTKSYSGAPVGSPSASRPVESAADAMIRTLQAQARNSYVPQEREAALTKLQEIYSNGFNSLGY
jgi:hypothetical protein